MSACFSVLAPHLIEVCIDILSAALVQLHVADFVSKAGDADDIVRLQVLDEEVTTGLGHILHLIPGENQGSFVARKCLTATVLVENSVRVCTQTVASSFSESATAAVC